MKKFFQLFSKKKKYHRPWGYYKSLSQTEDYQIKEIVVYPGKRLSLQSHEKRSEVWTVIRGEAVVQVNEEEIVKKEQESIYIPKQAKHRLWNKTDKNLMIVEVQMGTYFGEDDIIRYVDDFERM